MTEIRRAVDDDATALSELGARTFRDAFEADNNPSDFAMFLSSAYSPALQLAEIRNPAVDTLLAVEDRALIGFTQVRVGAVATCVQVAAPIELQRIYVDRRWHGRGIADLLMDAAKDAARRRGGKHIWLGVWERNTRAQAFYRRCGFTKIGTQTFVVGTDPQTDQVMVCALTPMSP